MFLLIQSAPFNISIILHSVLADLFDVVLLHSIIEHLFQRELGLKVHPVKEVAKHVPILEKHEDLGGSKLSILCVQIAIQLLHNLSKHYTFLLLVRFGYKLHLRRIRVELDELLVCELHGEGVALHFGIRVESNVSTSVLERQYTTVSFELIPRVVRDLNELVRVEDFGLVSEDVAEDELFHRSVVRDEHLLHAGEELDFVDSFFVPLIRRAVLLELLLCLLEHFDASRLEAVHELGVLRGIDVHRSHVFFGVER